MIETQKYVRKPLFVDAVQVTEANFESIAEWCQGEIVRETRPYVRIRVHNPKTIRQSQAFAGDWILYTERGYKIYTERAFHNNFDLVENDEDPDQQNLLSEGEIMSRH